jgi:arylsulfatase A-like enzyme/tetratricopeptide (TPR) repeat protein
MDSPPAPLPQPFQRPGRSRWRYALILIAVSIASVLAAAGGWRFARTSQSPANGPIILISIGTLRADHLPVYGYRQVDTPALDAFAGEGVVFDRAYAHSPQTLPSHASILSGLLPFETGIRDDGGFPLPPGVTLLPQMLKARGYAAGAVVSSWLLRKDTGLDRGFDFFNGASDGAPGRDAAAASDVALQRPGEDSVAIAERWIASLSSPRFFLFLHLDEPHAPYAAPSTFGKYAPYDAEVAFSDRIVGTFFDWLKGRGLYDRATIIVVSDHGEGLGDHGEQGHGLLLHDSTLRVPLLVRLPREVNHGRRVSVPVQHIDLVPTILDLLDVPRPSGLRGRSLRALVEGRKAPPTAQPIYAESFYGRYHFGWSELRAITDGDERFVLAPRQELYDLKADPAERTDLASARPESCDAMRATLQSLVSADTPPPRPAAISDDDRRRLASLGTVGTAPNVKPGLRLPDPKDKAAIVETYREAWTEAAQGRFVQAATLYQDIVKKEPGLVDAWLHLADAQARAGRVPDAVDAYTRALKVAPDSTQALLGAADGLRRLGRLDEARARAALAVPAQPAAAHELLARIALKRGDDAEAKRQAQLAAEADPALPMPLFVQGAILARAGGHEAAVPLFEQAIEAEKRRGAPVSELHFALGESLARLDRYGDAEAQFNEEVRAFPQHLQARISLAMLYRTQRRDADLELAIKDLLRASPTAEGYAAAARLWTIFGETDRAAAARAEARQRFGR